MKFFGIATFALAAFTGLVSAIDSTTVKNDIVRLTQLSEETNQMVSSINVVNFAIKAPQVPQGIAKIVDLIFVVVKDLTNDPKPFEDAAAQEIVVVLTTFVKVHQALLNTIIGKHGIITLLPFFGPPVSAALVLIEKAVDSLAFFLIALIPTRKNEAMNQGMALMGTLDAAKKAYSQDSILGGVTGL